MAVYRFKVSFEDFEDIYREIEVTSEQTFADFYKAILSSIKFEDRGTASFFMSNDSWKKGVEISNSDKTDRDGKPVAKTDKSFLKSYIADPHQKIYFLIDCESVWAFHIELVKILAAADVKLSYPHVRKVSGDAPSQFKVKIAPVLEDDDFVDTDVSDESNSVADEFAGENDYDEDDTATLEGEEGEERTDEDSEEFNDVEMGSDENYEES
ncbi:MAG: plasmid pRiA4b ORF-3 family protein [Bacteroidia bacterium]|nr:plasmid pRiA4b ORF-3 family protein [Bacteroidia bacterium]MCW5920112.1 hypothetical protein [Bacteroidota bacterium]MCC7514939.1 hypothetical protein [Bacteroidia bacterium]HCI58120.1 hypothetical protein [Bacteroidota bacterium]HMW10653.1 hypothetical protein [Bacteroidia bacterium]